MMDATPQILPPQKLLRKPLFRYQWRELSLFRWTSLTPAWMQSRFLLCRS